MDVFSLKAKDLVWAKMKGFSPWPAMITDPPEHMLKVSRKNNVPVKCVFFFGSKNYAWIELNEIKPFENENKDKFLKTGKSNSFKEAVEEIQRYIEDPTEIESILLPPAPGYDSDAEFNKVRDGVVDETNDSVAEATPRKNARTKTKSVSAKSNKSAVSNKSTPAAKRKRSTTNDSRKKINTDFLTPSSSRRGGGAKSALLDRPLVTRPEIPTVTMGDLPASLAERGIQASEATFGFLGLGIMGSTIVKNLIYTGHKVILWNRTMEKCDKFVESGAEIRDTPGDVAEDADVIFCCVSDPKAIKEMVFGNCGVLSCKESWPGKCYVEMSTIDPETSTDIAYAIKEVGGLYLEAQIQGTRQEVENGNVIILAGGDRGVFEKCHSCFKSIAKNTFFLGEIGNACKVNLIIQTIAGVSLVALSEALALADRFSISLTDILDILDLTSVKSGLLISKGKEMAKGEFTTEHALTHMQKDIRLVLDMAHTVDQSMPATAVANEVFKHAKRLGYSDHDSSAVYVRARF